MSGGFEAASEAGNRRSTGAWSVQPRGPQSGMPPAHERTRCRKQVANNARAIGVFSRLRQAQLTIVSVSIRRRRSDAPARGGSTHTQKQPGDFAPDAAVRQHHAAPRRAALRLASASQSDRQHRPNRRVGASDCGRSAIALIALLGRSRGGDWAIAPLSFPRASGGMVRLCARSPSTPRGSSPESFRPVRDGSAGPVLYGRSATSQSYSQGGRAGRTTSRPSLRVDRARPRQTKQPPGRSESVRKKGGERTGPAPFAFAFALVF
jgi:hypothetical protein